MSCGCSGADCSCNFAAGDGMTITGNGSKSNPYVITASGGASNLDTADTSSLVWTETGSGTPSDPLTLSANVALSVPAPSLNTYNANATWTKPGGITRVRVIMAGGGGGGSGGGRQAGSDATQFLAGLGGWGGGYTIREFAASALPATVAITVGAGGTGGNGATVIGPGAAGAAGGASSFGTLLSVPGGAGGVSANSPSGLVMGGSGHGVQGLTPGGGGWGGSVGYGGTQITAQRTNLVPNPSFETNVNFWQGSCAGCNQTTTRVIDPAVAEFSVMRATGKNENFVMNIISGGINVVPGATYFFQGSFLRNNNANWGSTRVQPVISFIDVNNTGLGTINPPYTNMTNPNQFYISWGNFTVPNDPRIAAAYLQFNIENWNIVNISTAMYVNTDAFQLERVSAAGYQSYFDGNTSPGGGNTSYAWTGTPHNSTSTATTIGGLSVFTQGVAGNGVPIPPLAGGTAGGGGGTGLSPAAVGPGGNGGAGQASTLATTKPGGGGGGGAGAGSTPGIGGNGVVGGGGGGGGTGLSPQNGGKGGNGGNGFVTVIAW